MGYLHFYEALDLNSQLSQQFLFDAASQAIDFGAQLGDFVGKRLGRWAKTEEPIGY
jgi:hypothetical protein